MYVEGTEEIEGRGQYLKRGNSAIAFRPRSFIISQSQRINRGKLTDYERRGEREEHILSTGSGRQEGGGSEKGG